MKNFINQIISSVYNPSFYKDLQHKDSSFTILYILKLWGLVSVLTALAIVVIVHQYQSNLFANAQVDSIRGLVNKYVDTYFADDLVISFKNFNLTTNKTEPVIFPVPKDWFDLDNDEGEIPTNILVISPDEVSSASLLEKYDAIGVLSSTSAAYYDNEQNNFKISKYSDLDDKITPITDHKDDLVITKDIAKNKINQAIDYFWYLVPFLYLIIFIIIVLVMFVLASVAEFIYAIFSGLLAYIVSLLTKSGGTYGLWYLRALHADTLYILLAMTLGWFIPLSSIPFLALAMVIGILVMNKNFINK